MTESICVVLVKDPTITNYDVNEHGLPAAPDPAFLPNAAFGFLLVWHSVEEWATVYHGTVRNMIGPMAKWRGAMTLNT